MAIKISGTTVINDNRNIENIGVATANSFKGSAQVGVATGGTYIGLTTQFNFVGSGVGVTHAYNATAGITTITFTSSGGGGSTASGDGSAFNTGITSALSAVLTGIGTTVFTFPSTAGQEYIVYSINAANVFGSPNAGLSTEINVIGAFDFNGGERSHFAYNIPIPPGTAIELLRQPQILQAGDSIVMRSTDIDRVGVDNSVHVYVTYHQKTATEYFGIGLGATVGIATTTAIGIFTATTYPAILQSIRLTNITDAGPYPISVTVTSGITTRSLVDNLVIPKYASVELLDTPKRLNLNDVLKIKVEQLSTIDVQVSGKQITS